MNVDLNNIDDLLFNSLENIEIEPSATVKESIKKRMFYHNLMKSIYVKLGTFALFSIILTSVILNYTDTNINNIADRIDVVNNKIKKENNNKTKKIITEKNNIQKQKNNTSSLVLTTSKTQENEQNIVLKLNDEKENRTKITIKNQNKSITKNIILKSNNIKSTISVKQKNTENTTKNIELAYITEKIKKKKLKNDNLIQPSITKKNTIIKQIFPQEKHIKEKQNYSFLNYKKSVLLNQHINKQKLEVPEFKIPDDTVGYDINKKPIVLPSNRWYVDLYFSPNYSNSKFINNSNEFAYISDKLNNETKATFGYNIGINAGYIFKNFALNLGVAYSEFNQKIDSKYNEQILTNINYYEYSTSTDWQLDTIFYWNLDSLIQGDSVITPIVDSVQITLLDSTIQTKTDTSFIEKTTLKTNKYKYIEFPLTVEYIFNRGKKISPFINGGLITGLLIKTSTYTYETNNGTLIQDNSTPYIKPNFWLVFSAGARYNINDKYSLTIYPYYRYNLKSIIENTNIYSQKINIWGINFGIRYTF